MPHDCRFCRFTRRLLVVGMSLMAVVCLAASVTDLILAQYERASKEFLAVFFCLVMAWLGLMLLKGIYQFFDWIWPDRTSDQY